MTWQPPPPPLRSVFRGLQTSTSRRAAVVVYTVGELLYLAWRAGFTLAGAPTLYAWVFLLAEAWVILNAIWFYVLMQHVPRPVPAPPPPIAGLEIDVFIPTYNEDVQLVRVTAVAARNMDYPHRTFICDDGRRPSMAAMAREIGVGYLTRPTNAHYKAGNLNHALSTTRGDLVLILDADHVPRRGLLTRLVGYFRDPRLALAQIPQVYYNLDSYQHRVSDADRLLWHEGCTFQHRIMEGVERVCGSAFFIGTGALLRRSALEAVGGFATGSVTEDIFTSMRLHARGYRSVFVNEALAFLLAAQSPFAYARQRLRWAQGGLQILRRENPLFVRGLSWRQRIAYFSSLSSSLSCYPNLLFYLAPALFLLFGLNPVVVAPNVVIPAILANFVFNQLIYLLLASPDGRVLESEFFKLINLPIHLRASLRLLFPDGLEFKVTPKGRQDALPLSMWLPATLLIALNLSAIAVGAERVRAGFLGLGASTLALCFAVAFVLLGFVVLRRALRTPRDGEPVNVRTEIDTAVRRVGDGWWGDAKVQAVGTATSIIESPCAMGPGDLLELDLRDSGVHRAVTAEVRAVESNEGGRYRAQVTLRGLSSDERDRLGEFIFNTALPAYLTSFANGPMGPPPVFPEVFPQAVGRPAPSGWVSATPVVEAPIWSEPAEPGGLLGEAHRPIASGASVEAGTIALPASVLPQLLQDESGTALAAVLRRGSPRAPRRQGPRFVVPQASPPVPGDAVPLAAIFRREQSGSSGTRQEPAGFTVRLLRVPSPDDSSPGALN